MYGWALTTCMLVVNAHLFFKVSANFLAKRLVVTIIICTFALAIEKRGVAQSGSAPGLGPGGRRFESCRPDKQKRLFF